MLKETEILVIGGGPAGLGAAITASRMGAQVLLVDRQNLLGGQLIKQTHMFFGSQKEQASVRGIQIASNLTEQVEQERGITTWLKTTALGFYEDGVITLEQESPEGSSLLFIKPQVTIVATGASEKTLAFPGVDLPGVYGAGAVQTLMNVHGVIPGFQVLMLGAGNIGLIVSYQLLQAGVEVLAVVEAGPVVGGYLVHASKIARLGVPILTSHTVEKAWGGEVLEGVTTIQVNPSWEPVPGTQQDWKVDTLCVAVGLSPLSSLLWQAGCRMYYVPLLGGHVAWRSETMETSVKGLFIAGDVAGIEEASSAMVEGEIAGYYGALSLGYPPGKISINELEEELAVLRSGPKGKPIQEGLSLLGKRGGAGNA